MAMGVLFLPRGASITMLNRVYGGSKSHAVAALVKIDLCFLVRHALEEYSLC